jgi:hypothetical protein
VNHSTKYALGTFLGLILAFSAVPGHAQGEPKVKATIPFNFVIGDKELKAGEYLIKPVGSLRSQNLLQFRSENGDVQQIALTLPIETKKAGNHERLVFHHDGNQYFLSQVWLSGDENGHELIPGAQENKAATNRSTGDQVVASQ